MPFDNNVAQRDVEVETADPCAQPGSLTDYIATLALQQGLAKSLTAKLRNAERNCERGKTTPACNQIGAFENQLEAKTGEGITAAQTTVLRDHSDAIKAAMGC